jgi:hypothetical protein
MLYWQVGWQDCITRLLVKRPISTSELQQSGSLPDLMSFDEENLVLEDASYSPSSVSRISTHVTDAALVLENEIKGNCWPAWSKVFGLTLLCFSLELAAEACTSDVYCGLEGSKGGRGITET